MMWKQRYDKIKVGDLVKCTITEGDVYYSYVTKITKTEIKSSGWERTIENLKSRNSTFTHAAKKNLFEKVLE